MACEPPVSAEVWKVAVPPDSVAVAMTVAPSRNSTWPEGVPVPGLWACTCAVKVACWP